MPTETNTQEYTFKIGKVTCFAEIKKTTKYHSEGTGVFHQGLEQTCFEDESEEIKIINFDCEELGNEIPEGDKKNFIRELVEEFIKEGTCINLGKIHFHENTKEYFLI